MTSNQTQKNLNIDEIYENEILLGTIEGLRFMPSQTQKNQTQENQNSQDNTSLSTTQTDIISKQLELRAERLINAPNEEILLASDGYLRWRGQIIANLSKGEKTLSPNIILLTDNNIPKDKTIEISERLNLWLSHHINVVFEQIKALENPIEIDKNDEANAQAIELTKQLASHFGILPRQKIASLVKSLDQDIRGKLRRLGIKFGAYHIYLPLSLKPAQRELALILYALKNGDIKQAGVSELPQIILSGRTSFEIDKEINPSLYEIAGFKIAGNRAVRIDILERLADLIRPLVMLNPLTIEGELPEGAAEKNGFRVTVEMTSLLGCAGEDFSSILKSLGYRLKRTPIKQEAQEQEVKPQEDKLRKADLQEVESQESEPQEEKFDDIWFPAPFRSEHNKQNSKNSSKNTNHHNKSKQSLSAKKKKHAPKHHNKIKAKPFDPDSPFAALMALKNNTDK